MLDPKNNYLVSEPNSAGIYTLSIKSGAHILDRLKLNEYLKGTKIIELGAEYNLVMNSSLEKVES